MKIEEEIIKNKIWDIVNEISRFSKLHTLATSDSGHRAYAIKMKESVNCLYELMLGVQAASQLSEEQKIEENASPRVFDADELAIYNGTNGKPPYVAINGRVYDVSTLPYWKEGVHFGLIAGQDHTKDFMICHGGMLSLLEQLPVVGVMADS